MRAILGRSIWARAAFSGLALAGVLALAPCVSGCAVSESDVHRWESTEQGPRKLYAVVTHDKYAWPLRVEAAMSLIRMKPRGGKNLTMPYLIEGVTDDSGAHEGALIALSPDERKRMVESLAPQLVQGIEAPPPPKNPDGTTPPDPSVLYKDAAFAMISHDPPIVTDDKIKADLSTAITQWAMADFENRLDVSQQYGVEQTFRFIGPASVKGLPALLTESASKIDRMAALIHDLGDPDTKLKASQALVTIAKKIDSQDWINKQTPLVQDADNRAGQKVNADQLKAQVKQYQDQELQKIFSAMNKVGGRPVIDYCLDFAAGKDKSEDSRKAALAAIAGSVDKNNAQDINRLFAVAADDATPDGVRDLAFQRLGELPKEQVVPKLYQLFGTQKWKVRWVAASLVLKTLPTSSLGEFMSHLPASPATKMGMTEPISYGGLIANMAQPAGAPKPRDAVMPFLSTKAVGAKLTALGFFYNGRKADIAVVQSHADDAEAVPKCDQADDCGWQCDVPKSPGSADKESKEIKTVGDFTKYCVIPSMNAP